MRREHWKLTFRVGDESESQAFASDAPAVCEYLAAILCGHAGTETYAALTGKCVWLKCAFHFAFPLFIILFKVDSNLCFQVHWQQKTECKYNITFHLGKLAHRSF